MMRGQVRKWWVYVALLILISANAIVLWQHQRVADYWMLAHYHAPDQIQSLVNDDDLTPTAKHLLYVNRPEVADRTTFNKYCSSEVEKTVVLGCYLGDRGGIYIYSVTDSRLSGVEQVTVAHEMLHEAFDRLSDSERRHIVSLLQDYVDHQLSDTNVREKLDAYKQSSASALPTEMHSVIGTEVHNLPSELEKYYKRYFNDRTKIVKFSDAYEGEFSKRQAQIRSYDSQLMTLSEEIKTDKTDLDIKQKTLDDKKQALDRAARDGNASLYHQLALAYNALVDSYNQEINATKALIDQYNQIVSKRNDIAVEEFQLQQALDSHYTASQ